MIRMLFRLSVIFVFIFFAVASATTDENKSPQCKNAQAQHSFCLSACLGRTPGNWTLLQSMGYCGNQCAETAMAAGSVCR